MSGDWRISGGVIYVQGLLRRIIVGGGRGGGGNCDVLKEKRTGRARACD